MVQLANISKEYHNSLQLGKKAGKLPIHVQAGLRWFALQVPDVRIVAVEEQ